MSLNVRQFRNYVLKPTLQRLNMDGKGAEALLLGTAAVESKFHYLKQNGGPALGIFQIEPITLWDIVDRWLAPQRDLRESCKVAFGFDPCELELLTLERLCVGHLGFAVGLARFKYRMDPNPIPLAEDLPGLAAYWKRVYNTHLGAGTPEKFIQAYRELVL